MDQNYMNNNSSNNRSPHNNTAHGNYLHKHHMWYNMMGIGLVVLGFLEVAFAFLSTIFSIIYLGFFFILSSVFEAYQALQLRGLGSFVLHIALSALYLFAGLFIISDPVRNAVTLTLLLASFFCVMGIIKIVMALTHRVLHVGWFIIDGLISLTLGILIWMQWPADSLWVIGTLVGINTIFTGITWIMASSAAKHVINNK